MTANEQADEILLAEALRRKLQRLAKAQALAWNGLDRATQMAYMKAVDQLEGQRG